MKTQRVTSKGNNVVSLVVDEGLCLHCGTCLAVCPTHSIEAALNSRGDLEPRVGESCLGCGLCVEVCPGAAIPPRKSLNQSPQHNSLGDYESLFVARALSPILQSRRVASGGVVSAIARKFLDEFPNGLVQWTSLAINGAIRPETRLLDSEAFEGTEGDSVYTPSFANAVFRDVSKDKPILAIGLPCQIHGLAMLCKVRPGLADQIHGTISLFCGLTVSTSGIKSLIEKAGHNVSEMADFRFRGDNGAEMTTRDGKTLRLNKNSVNWSHICRRCVLCPDHTGELADISCGDAWLEPLMKKTKSRCSWSTVIARSAFGEELIRRCVKDSYLWAMQVTSQEVIESQRPMLTFKKKTYFQRLALNRTLRGHNPTVDKNWADYTPFSIRVFLGNLVLLLHFRLRKRKWYERLLTKPFLLEKFNQVIMRCLYQEQSRRTSYRILRGFCGKVFRRVRTRVFCFIEAKLRRWYIQTFHSKCIPRERIQCFEAFSDDWARKFQRISERLLRSADNYRDGKVQIFSHNYDLNKHGWNCNPVTKVQYPTFSEKGMGEHLDFRKYGDPKDAYELHKHYGLVELALAARITHDDRYLDALLERLSSWQKRFPPGIGIGWCGNVHVAQRMIAWCFVYMLLEKTSFDQKNQIQKVIVSGLQEHAAMLKSRYRFPSNNHKIGSLCSLIIYEWLFGEKTGRRLQRYFQDLSDSVAELVSADGAPMEGSLAYGLLVLEFLLLLKLFAASLGHKIPAKVVERAEAMVSWYAEMLGPETALPPFGDSSNEHGFPFNEYMWDVGECIRLGQTLFSTGHAPPRGSLASLLLDVFKINTLSMKHASSYSSSFVDGIAGYGRVSRKTDIGRCTVWMRNGMFGFPPNYAHSHCDGLSPIVSLDGIPVLWEAGTFRYNVDTEERLADVLSQGHSGIRCEMLERDTWHNIFRWKGSPLPAKLYKEHNGLVASLILPDQSALSRMVTIARASVVIRDVFESKSSREKLFEWTFILDGVEEEERPTDGKTIVFRHAETNTRFSLTFGDGWQDNWKLSSARIATSYGMSHTGSRVSIKCLASGGWTRMTTLSIA